MSVLLATHSLPNQLYVVDSNYKYYTWLRAVYICFSRVCIFVSLYPLWSQDLANTKAIGMNIRLDKQ